MFDYVKMVIDKPGFNNELVKNPLLSFLIQVNSQTGEIPINKQIAQYKGLTFTVYETGRVEIKGSLHKYWNNGVHNYNDFSFEAVQSVIEDLRLKFGVDSFLARISNLEIGLNINTPFEPKGLLDRVLAYNNSQFNKMVIKGNGLGKEVLKQQYKIKIYDKGSQYLQPQKILRFEKKYIKMINLREGVITLSDLGHLGFAQLCLNQLIDSFDNVVITETINLKSLTKCDFRIYEFCNNPLNWERMNRKKRHRYKQKFEFIISEFGKEALKKTIRTLLLAKAMDLIKMRTF